MFLARFSLKCVSLGFISLDSEGRGFGSGAVLALLAWRAGCCSALYTYKGAARAGLSVGRRAQTSQRGLSKNQRNSRAGYKLAAFLRGLSGAHQGLRTEDAPTEGFQQAAGGKQTPLSSGIQATLGRAIPARSVCAATATAGVVTRTLAGDPHTSCLCQGFRAGRPHVLGSSPAKRRQCGDADSQTWRGGGRGSELPARLPRIAARGELAGILGTRAVREAAKELRGFSKSLRT